jgi:hypothetical protein
LLKLSENCFYAGKPKIAKNQWKPGHPDPAQGKLELKATDSLTTITNCTPPPPHQSNQSYTHLWGIISIHRQQN